MPQAADDNDCNIALGIRLRRVCIILLLPEPQTAFVLAGIAARVEWLVCVCVCVCVSSTAGDAEEEEWQLVGHVRAYVGLRQLCNPLKGQCVCVCSRVCVEF